jgi:hypothetical protein
MRLKTLLCLLLVICLSFSVTPIARADDVGGNNSFDPNYKPTPAELAQLTAKDKMARAHAKSFQVNAAYSKYLNVGSAETYREPSGEAHNQYCGPTSTQVAIRARVSAASVPKREVIAKAENMRDNGVYIQDIKPYLNSFLHTTWYSVGAAVSPYKFSDWTRLDVDINYVLITGVVTDGMPGWTKKANHIVPVYGYAITSGTYISTVAYVDTGSDTAGHRYDSGGKYFNTAPLTKFYNWVARNNLQVW